jgi:hypothetical protein
MREEQEDFEVKLSFVTLSDDNNTLLLNGNRKYKISLPDNFNDILLPKEQHEVVSLLIVKGCSDFKVDYVSDENITNCAKEVMQFKRERAISAFNNTKLQEKQQEEERKERIRQKAVATRIASRLPSSLVNSDDGNGKDGGKEDE